MMDQKTPEIVILGAGKMGTAIARGFALKLPGVRIYLSQKDSEIRERLIREGWSMLKPGEFLPGCSMVVVATKPEDVPAVMQEIPAIAPRHTPIVSVAAALSLESLTEMLPDRPVFRGRPNILVEIGKGNFLLAKDHPTRWRESYEEVKRLFSFIARVYELPEAETAKFTWESSSIPIVLVGKLMRARWQAHSEPGERQLALELILRGLQGLCEYLQAGEQAGDELVDSLIRLEEQVVSKGGLNETAFSLLEQSDFWPLLEEAARVYLQKEHRS